MEYENKEICSKCGGKCCKKSGCDYFVDDFKPITKSKILDVLQSGNVSIVSALNFGKTNNGKITCVPFLYLRARNKNRDVIDLFSMKTECSVLTETGCKYKLEDRPSGGVNLIPKENFNCTHNVNQLDEIKKGEEFQNLLSKIVKRLTGKTPEEKLKEDIESVFVQILNEDFEGVSKLEIKDILSSVDLLVKCYPEELEKALIRCNKKVLKITR